MAFVIAVFVRDREPFVAADTAVTNAPVAIDVAATNAPVSADAAATNKPVAADVSVDVTATNAPVAINVSADAAATNAPVAADVSVDVTVTNAPVAADVAVTNAPAAADVAATNAPAAAVAAVTNAPAAADVVATNAPAAADAPAANKTAAADAPAAKEKPPIETRVFKLNHVSASEVAEKLNTMWNGEFGQVWKVTKMAVAFEESNQVMVTAPGPILDACQSTVKQIDSEPQQVYIEARFVELGNTASHKVGIDWQMLDGMAGSLKVGGGIEGYNVGKGVENYTRTVKTGNESTSFSLVGGTSTSGGSTFSGGGNGSVTHFTGTLDFSQMYLIMRALDSTEDAKTFSNPKIIVSSGKKAKVDMTEKYPNVTISAKRTTSGGSDSLDLSMNMAAIPGEDKFMFAKEAFFSWGIELEVTPRISTNGLINVQIVPTISDRVDWVTSGAGDTANNGNNAGTYSSKYPVINVQRLITEFSMASGTTAVIGGLSRTVETQSDNGIPVLKSIPWLGRLFSSMVRVKEQREIIVFVTVGLVNPRAMEKDAGLPKNAVLGRQYTRGEKQEPGDRTEVTPEGLDSLDMRPLREQAKDPLRTNRLENASFDFNNIPVPFRRKGRIGDGYNTENK